MFHLKVGSQVLGFKIRSTSEGEITHMTSQINTCSKNFLHFSIFQRKDHSDCTSFPVLQVFFAGPHLYFLLFRVIHCCVWLHKFYGSQINLVRYGALISFYTLYS